jgi:hypothetical protein
MVVSVRNATALFCFNRFKYCLMRETLVIGVQRRNDPFGDDAGAEPTGRARVDTPAKNQLHLAWPPNVEVLANDFLEEQPAHG